MCECVCEEWQCVSGTGITDLGKRIDRDKRIYLLEGQKWRDEMNEGRERDIEKMSDSSWWGISKRAGETAEKNKCVCLWLHYFFPLYQLYSVALE